MERDSDFTSDVLKIGLGIVFGGLVLWFLFNAYVNYQLHKAGEALDSFVADQQQQEAQRIAAQRRIEADKWADDVFAKREANKRRVAVESAQRHADALAAEKQAAWLKASIPSARCEHPETFDVNVECSNAYMKAKREFDAKWSRDHP